MTGRSIFSCLSVGGLCGLLLACGGDGGRESSGGPGGIGSVGPDTATSEGTSNPTEGTSVGTSAGATEGADGSSGGGMTAGLKFDLGEGSDITVDDGCAAVDFIFVIDNSISMQDQQNALKAAFPLFIDTIQNTLPTTDYHIMVVDTDAWGRCDTANPWSGSNPGSSTCTNYIKNTVFEECDRTRGAGVIHPAGQGASDMLCVLQGGNRYIVEGQPDLATTFECIASVGLAGHPSERPLDGMVESVSPALLTAGGCNEGFLRDDAILVVTFLSDDPNVEDQNTAQTAYDAIVAAKGGNADAIVMLGLIPGGQGHWVDFISMFGERGIEGPIASNDYNQFFLDAVSIIEDTCLDFQG
ncbi:hypothetical protein [Paraliomyxa miuraensis]|uniref:hypothetical protein n=1 Tax=Paraliomyxa miuraensis TaxID=376150 RepID=UPI0022576292|nr:hypothetical protein [Paraliomyxa miuraensis]MCX4242254.1 hypothetical protein [Paraliomyxa miuraensis]